MTIEEAIETAQKDIQTTEDWHRLQNFNPPEAYPQGMINLNAAKTLIRVAEAWLRLTKFIKANCQTVRIRGNAHYHNGHTDAFYGIALTMKEFLALPPKSDLQRVREFIERRACSLNEALDYIDQLEAEKEKPR